jgi:HPt (histidine-containing phosphotransfer) domain-containing protein
MDDYLSKPIRREDLDPVLERWLGTALPVADGVVDSGRVDRLNSMSPGTHERLVQVFARTTPPLLQALRGAVEQGEDETRRKLAHRLRGSSDAVGARRLSALAWDLEHGDRPDTAVAELEPVYRETLEQLHRAAPAIRR